MRLKLFGLLAAGALVAGACSNTPAASSGGSTAAPSAATSAAASAAASAPASAAASGGGAGAGTLTVARLADWYNFFHPVEFQTGNQFQWWNTIFNTLVTVSDDSKTITPGLADTWDVSTDAKVYTFHLHPGIKWHDGTAFTAKDVVYSATFYAQNPKAYKGFVPVWGQIAGAADIADKPDGVLSGIEAPDDNTVKITLEECELDLPRPDDRHGERDPAAAHPQGRHGRRRREGSVHARHARHDRRHRPIQADRVHARPVGRVTANPDYFRGAPKIHKIVFKLFADTSLAIAQLQSGDLDLAFRVAAERIRQPLEGVAPSHCRHAEPGHLPDRVRHDKGALGQEGSSPGFLLRDQSPGSL